MSDDDLTIMPSWQDVAERWEKAWQQEARAREAADARAEVAERNEAIQLMKTQEAQRRVGEAESRLRSLKGLP